MPLESGTQLGPYRILETIGEGGMGEVHKATDTRLDRTVAIKVLPPRFSEDAEMRQRFEREARVIAALNHPHICTLHDVGREGDVDFLVMEFLEGESLAQRLERGPIPADEAVKIAIDIADALDKAHAQGVTHRDLKPGNVMLTESGAKLLDFGLSKLAQPETGPGSEQSEVDSTVPSTLPGTVLGTLPYMSPEQLDGSEAGPRTDLWAFGALLYEMLAGKRAFGGKSQAVLIAGIVSADPEPLAEAVRGISPAIDYIVTRCLTKDPEERIQNVYEVLAQLKWIASGGEEAPGAGEAPTAQREKMLRWGLVAAIVLVAILIPTSMSYFLGSDAADATRFLVDVPDMPVPESIAMSPDGAMMAYAARDGGGTALFLRPTDAFRSQRVAGTEGAERPFWSPDSQSVGFYANGQLKRVDIDGSAPPEPVVDTPDFGGGTWSEDGVILFASSAGLQRVPAPGGDGVAVAVEGSAPRSPWFLPGGEEFLYLAGEGESAAIHAGSLSGGGREILGAGSNPVYAEPGYLLFHREGTLFADSFDAGSLEPGGEAIRIAEGIPYSDSGAGAFSASDNGVLIYRSTPPAPDLPEGAGTSDILPVPLVWVDRRGQTLEQLYEEDAWFGVDISPTDGRRVAAHRHEPAGGDVWVFEPGLAEPRKLTLDAGQDNSSPIWSPDGSRIAFGSRRDGQWGLYVKLAEAGVDEQLLASDTPIVPMSWVGDYLVYQTSDPGSAGGIAYLKLGEDGWEDPVVFLDEPAVDERHAQLSPDARWIAYSSNHTGQSEIYIQAFPEGPAYIDISVDGGVFPRWRADGERLYFMSLVTVGGMLEVPIGVTGAQIRKTGDPAILFQTGYFYGAHEGGYAHAYAVSADGERFLIPQVDTTTVGSPPDIGQLLTRVALTVGADRNAASSPAGGSAAPINGILDWTAILNE